MAKYSYHVINVFTRNGRGGNPLALFIEPYQLRPTKMQVIAAKIGFSETVFLQPMAKVAAGADYRVRIFTPQSEIPFAGHPTLGTLFTLLHKRLLPKKRSYVQQVGRRMIPLFRNGDGSVGMQQGVPTITEAASAAEAEKMLSLPAGSVVGLPMVISTGLPQMIIPLQSYAALKQAKVHSRSYNRLAKKHGFSCVVPFVIWRSALRCRMFAPLLGIAEDAATGSAAGVLASYVVLNYLAKLPKNGTVKVDVLQGVGRNKSLLSVVLKLSKSGVKGIAVAGFCKHIGTRQLEL